MNQAAVNYLAELNTLERPEIARGYVSPSALAMPLAHCLLTAENRGEPRPDFKPRAGEQDGTVRDLTAAEEEELQTALSAALDHLRESREVAIANLKAGPSPTRKTKGSVSNTKPTES
jgi:hypothetical protein